MKAHISLACAAFLLHLTATADSTHPTYTTAFAAYKNGDCKTALPAFRKYMSEDAPFLFTHTEFKASVLAAIAYCTPTPGADSGPWLASISPDERNAVQARIFANQAKADATAAVVSAKLAEDAAKKAEAKAPGAKRFMQEKGFAD